MNPNLKGVCLWADVALPHRAASTSTVAIEKRCRPQNSRILDCRELELTTTPTGIGERVVATRPNKQTKGGGIAPIGLSADEEIRGGHNTDVDCVIWKPVPLF